MIDRTSAVAARGDTGCARMLLWGGPPHVSRRLLLARCVCDGVRGIDRRVHTHPQAVEEDSLLRDGRMVLEIAMQVNRENAIFS